MRFKFRGFDTPHLTLLLLASVTLNVLALALPIMTMQIYNRILPNEASDTLVALSAGVLLAVCIEFALKLARHKIVSLNAANFELNTGKLLLSRLLDARTGSYNNYSPVRMTQDIQAVARLKDDYTGVAATTLMLDIPFMALLFMLMAYLAGWVAIVPAITLMVYGALFSYHGRLLGALTDENDRQDDRRYGFVTSALQSVHTIKANCLEAVTTRRFEALQSRASRIYYTAPYLGGRIDLLNASIAQIMTITLICVGAPMVVNHTMAIGTLIASILIAGQIVQPFQRSMALWLRQQDTALAARRVTRILDLPQSHKSVQNVAPITQGRLRLENVCFEHETDRKLLKNITLEIEPGTTVAIHGGAASGKTTLLELISGLYQPQSGHIYYAGTEVSAIEASQRIKSIAYLPMQGLILRGSIMDNLTGFDTRLQDSARNISALLGIDAAVALLPQGYDTMLEGMSTDVVSPGLRQRIAIARALLYRPQLILFDNADHGLDKESYTLVFNLLARLRGQATVIIISEDKNITSLADQEWQLLDGTLVPISETPAHLIVGMQP